MRATLEAGRVSRRGSWPACASRWSRRRPCKRHAQDAGCPGGRHTACAAYFRRQTVALTPEQQRILESAGAR